MRGAGSGLDEIAEVLEFDGEVDVVDDGVLGGVDDDRGEVEDAADAGVQMALGTWVEIEVQGAWVRSQLTWASPHGTLFLFTSAFGQTQSMSRRSRDKMLADHKMRVISERPVVDGALDAVAKAAMRNSLDSRI